MLKSLQINSDFAALPWLAGTRLMQRHGGSLRFSTHKPNVIVGPNGSGKSAVLGLIALRFLAHFFHHSALDRRYVNIRADERAWWGGLGGWQRQYTWLPGLECKTDQAPILYYRPNHLPGNEDNVVTAMMTGYMDAARAFAAMTENKSSGEQSQALLERMLQALRGDAKALPERYACVNWDGSVEPINLAQQAGRGWVGESDHLAETLKRVAQPQGGAIPMLVMDEPEQSLDARAEIRMWRDIEQCNTRRMQVIAATHSLYPILHPSRFNIIEAEDGYIQSVRALAA